MIVSHHSELDGTFALGGFGVAPAVCTLRLRHDVHRTGPPAALIGRGAAGHLDAVRATFESSRLPNPPCTGLATERHGAKTNVSARLTLSRDRGAGCSYTSVREQRRAESSSQPPVQPLLCAPWNPIASSNSSPWWRRPTG